MSGGRLTRLMTELDDKRSVTFVDEQTARQLLVCTADRGATLTKLYRVSLPDDIVLSPDNSTLGVQSD